MPYIPKNRIQTNLYTAGNEYYIQGVNPNYTGYYYKTYNGGIFSGKTPDDTPTYPLSPIEGYAESPEGIQNKIYIINDVNSYEYGVIKGIDLGATKDIPYLFYTKPTEEDYKLGEFRRYFCKKRNELIYLEISKKDHDRILNRDNTIDYESWISFNIPWTISGDPKVVASINNNIVTLKEKQDKLYGLTRYLNQDYLKYYKP